MNGEQRKGTAGGGVGSGATAVTAVGMGTVTVGLVPVVATSLIGSTLRQAVGLQQSRLGNLMPTWADCPE